MNVMTFVLSKLANATSGSAVCQVTAQYLVLNLVMAPFILMITCLQLLPSNPMGAGAIGRVGACD